MTRRVVCVLALSLALVDARAAIARRVRLVRADGAPVVSTTAQDGWLTLADEGAPHCVAGDHAPIVVAADVVDGATMTVQPGATLTLRALLPKDAPAAGVTVRAKLEGDLATCEVSGTTDAKGAVALAGLPAGPVRLRVVAPATMLAVEDELTARAVVGKPQVVDVLLHEALRVPVSVTETARRPIAGAVVRVLPDWSRHPLAPALGVAALERIEELDARTDGEGLIVLPLLPRRAGWRIVARAPGRAASSVTVDLRTVAEPPAQRLVLAPAGVLTLRAVDLDGLPLAGARARLSSLDAKDADLVSAPGLGGADGRVRADALPAGTWLVELTATGARPRTVRGIRVRAGATTDAGDVALEPGASLSGRVQSDGEPLAGAKIRLATFADGARLALDATTDSQGAFTFEGLDPIARCRLRASAEGHAEASREDVEAGADDVVLELKRLASLVVVVSTEGGEPAVAPTIAVGGDRFHAAAVVATRVDDERCAWRVAGLPPGRLALLVRVAGYAAELREGIELVPGDEVRVTIELHRGKELRGQVVDAETSAPIGGALVISQGGQALTDTDGSFTLADLRSPADVEATHPLRPKLVVRKVDLDRIGGADLVLEMESGGSVEGAVFGPSGVGLAGASVTSGLRSAISDAEGHYRLDGLPVGPCQLTKSNEVDSYDGYETASIVVARDVVVRRDFGGGSRVVGRVTRRGEPARSARLTWVQARLDDATAEPQRSGSLITTVLGSTAPGVIATATTDQDGRYVVSGIVAGTYGVSIEWEGRMTGRNVTVAPAGAETRVDFDLPGHHLAGRVVDAGTAAPIERALVRLDCGAAPPGGDASITISRPATFDGFVDLLPVDAHPGSFDSTIDGGRFYLEVGETSACKLGVGRTGYDSWTSPEPFDVDASRDDLVVGLTPRAKP